MDASQPAPADPPPTAVITGATGFLGGYAVKEFLDHGYRVVALGRRPERLEQLRETGAKTIACDLDSLPEEVLPGEKIDVVVHCAALSSPWGPWRDFERANVTGTANVIAFANRHRVRRLVHVSSPSVYAANRDMVDISEDAELPARSLNNYIRSKRISEQIVAAALTDGRLREAVVLRPRGLIGAGDPSLVPRMLQAEAKIGVPIIGDGHQLVDLTAVSNVALALRLAATAPGASGQVFNITNGDPREYLGMVNTLFGLLGRRPHLRHIPRGPARAAAAAVEAAYRVLPGRAEPPLTRYTLSTIAYSQTLDISRAREHLGYDPSESIDSALAAFTAEWEGH